ncbi:MAG TPA: glutamine synthetase family protein [Candidatus Pygmaiobacter gallistercoris]|nr:glutamine synthetase family protein [Candidatus Pygmaiobacter gallistercoris]
MYNSVEDVLNYVRENDVKFIRLAFCDIFGVQKNISIQASELPRAFESGISFDASAIRGFLNVEQSDLLLFPEPGTLAVLPWRPDHRRVARLFCSIRHPDGRPFEGDTRSLLRESARRALQQGYVCKFGPECEFYLFRQDEEGMPTDRPLDAAGYFDIAPLDRGENLRRDVCLALEAMGFQPEASHHEQGPGQNEIDFRYSTAVRAADNLVTFKAAVKAIAAQHGLYASFLPKPLRDAPGSGLHINMSLYDQRDQNLFLGDADGFLPQAQQFIAGILRRTAEISAFLGPIANSYARLGAFEAPRYLTWSRQNRSQLIRIPAAEGDFSRMELRSADPACNPYLAFALLIEAGLEGIKESLSLPAPTDRNLYEEEQEGLASLPHSLSEAVDLARKSGFVRRVLPGAMLENYLAQKEEEARVVEQSEDPFERGRALHFDLL